MTSVDTQRTTQATRVRGRLALRPTEDADCEFVVAVESQPDNARYVGQWSAARHRQVAVDAGWAHWIIEYDGAAIGFVILEDVDDPNGSVLLRRIAVAGKGRGHGREALRLVLHYAFEVLGCHRLWLFVAVENQRAAALYRRLGFEREGIARECIRQGDGHSSMYILSLLAPEYREERADQAKP